MMPLIRMFNAFGNTCVSSALPLTEDQGGDSGDEAQLRHSQLDYLRAKSPCCAFCVMPAQLLS